MNIIEALKTGKPIRRPISKHMGMHGDGWLGSEYVKTYLVGNQSGLLDNYNSIVSLINMYDLMAEDWEVQRILKTIELSTDIDGNFYYGEKVGYNSIIIHGPNIESVRKVVVTYEE